MVPQVFYHRSLPLLDLVSARNAGSKEFTTRISRGILKEAREFASVVAGRATFSFH